jgi:hypothetical protein
VPVIMVLQIVTVLSCTATRGNVCNCQTEFKLCYWVLKCIQLIERAELVSGETCVMVCIAARGIQHGRMIWRQREECD